MNTETRTQAESVKDWHIDDIESMDEWTAFELCEDNMKIKGHDVYLIDFGGYFGYSAVVFYGGRQIRFANDYELHHTGKTHDELRRWYIDALNLKLYTEDELAAPLADYSDYTRRIRFVRDLFALRADYLSCFRICNTEAEEKEYERKKSYPYLNPASFAWYKDQEFVKRNVELLNIVEQRMSETKDNYDYQKSAFLYELSNHEYHINYQGDWDTLSSFGNIEWHGQGCEARQKYYNELNFTETQRRAFEDAIREHLRLAEKNGWY